MMHPDANAQGSGEQVAAPPAPASDLESCVVQLTQARRDADEFRNRYLRAAADIENTRKQAEREAATRALRDKRRMLLDFLEVADNLERALAQPGAASPLQQGVEMVLRQLQQALARAGVQRMTVKAGDTFDPVYHEAVEVRTGETAEDVVMEVVRAGYLHEGEVLRPAQVIVARGRQ